MLTVRSIGHAKIWPRTAQRCYCCPMDVLSVLCYVFVHKFLFNPHLDFRRIVDGGLQFLVSEHHAAVPPGIMHGL